MSAAAGLAGPRAIAWAVAAFAIVNLGLVAVTGVKTGGDTGLYLDGAQRLIDGLPLVERQPSYAGYVAVVAACQALGVGVRGLVVVQVAVATLAASAVGALAAVVAGPVSGAIAVLLLVVDLETNRWHAYVLADSLYQSALVLAAWLAFRASAPPRAAHSFAVAVAALAAASFIRPEGWFAGPAAALLWVRHGVRRPVARRVSTGAVLFACLWLAAVVAPRLQGNVQAVGPAEMLRQGRTMWDSDAWRVSMPKAPPYTGGWGAAGSVIAYAAQHPVATSALVGARLLVHVVHVRPFYSRAHNVAIALWLVPVYGLAAYGGWAKRRHSVVGWCLAVVATQAAVVAATHADYDGRYLSHVLPLVYPLSACGVIALVAGRRGARSTGGTGALA